MDEMVIGRHPEYGPGLTTVSVNGVDLIVSSNDLDLRIWDPGSTTLVARVNNGRTWDLTHSS